MITRILILIFSIVSSLPLVHAEGDIDNNINVRDVTINSSSNSNAVLDDFYGVSDIANYFFSPGITGSD